MAPSRSNLLFAGLLAAFAATRLARLDALPAFVDEARHLNWAQRFRAERLFLKPLEDGKLLQVAVTAVVVPGAGDPLRAGRLASVVAGALGMWAAWRLGRAAGGADSGETVGLLAAALYLACPFTLVYDRMNLADVYLSSLAAVALLATLRLVAEPTPARGVALGLALAGCVLAKAPGLSMFVLPAAGVLLAPDRSRRLWSAVAVAYAVAIVLAAAPVAYFAGHTSQLAGKTGAGDESRLGVVAENVRLAASWLWSYWTPPVVALGLAGIALAAGRRRRPDLVLAVAAVVPLAAFTLLAYHWFPRYVLLTTVPFLVLAARALADGAARLAGGDPRRRGLVAAVGLGLTCAPGVAFGARFLADPASAPLPAVERFQLVDGWPSGYGWREAGVRLRDERARHPEGLTIVTDRVGHHTGQWVLKAEFMGDPGVEVRGLEMDEDEALGLVATWAGARPTYLVTGARARRFAGTPAVRAEHLGTYAKPDGTFVCNVYWLTPRG